MFDDDTDETKLKLHHILLNLTTESELGVFSIRCPVVKHQKLPETLSLSVSL